LQILFRGARNARASSIYRDSPYLRISLPSVRSAEILSCPARCFVVPILEFAAISCRRSVTRQIFNFIDDWIDGLTAASPGHFQNETF
jgi:hypothetical protein